MAAVEFAGRSAYLPAANALVLADLHLGRDAESNVQLPLGEAKALAERLAALLDRFDPATVVFAGDVVHAFDRIPPGITETLATLKSTVEDREARLQLVAGNHDGLLTEATDQPCQDEVHLADGETVVLHGHEPPEERASRYVIGHDHPAIRIEGKKHPCYLLGEATYRGGDVVMLPAFNPLARGTVVNSLRKYDFQSPIVSGGPALGKYRPVVWDESSEEALKFPPLTKLRRLL